eukprot:scaffold219566_cov36-Tisochrysis_lutea.AAC.1
MSSSAREGSAGQHPFWQPRAGEQYSSPWPHQPCAEQHCPLPHVVSASESVAKSRPQRPSERIPNHTKMAVSSFTCS